MPGDNELQIVLTLIDEASAKLKAITGDIKKDTDAVSSAQKDMGKASNEAHKSMQEQMKETSRGVREFRREMFFVTATIATVIATVKQAAEYNYEARRSFQEFSIAAKTLSVIVGTILTSALNVLTKAIKFVTDVLEALVAGFIKAFSFIAEFFANITQGPVAAYKRAMEVANLATDNFIKKVEETKNTVTLFDEMKNKCNDMRDALDKLNMMYLTGQISAQQYYSIISSNNVANYQEMQTRLALMQQLATQENLIRNQSLMDYQTDVNSRMSLLKTYQEFHHTAYSSMMDFSNMFIQKFSTGMTSALTSIIMGTKKAGEAFKEFGMAMVTAIVEFVIQYGIQMLIAWAISSAITAATVAQASAIAAAWLPAALFASIATLGAADAAGAAGMASAAGASLGVYAGLKAATAASSAVDLGTIHVTQKAKGGDVLANRAYLVGEQGPELFSPGVSGYITPNNRLGNLGTTVYIHNEINNPQVRSDEDIDKIAEEVSHRIATEIDRL